MIVACNDQPVLKFIFAIKKPQAPSPVPPALLSAPSPVPPALLYLFQLLLWVLQWGERVSENAFLFFIHQQWDINQTPFVCKQWGETIFERAYIFSYTSILGCYTDRLERLKIEEISRENMVHNKNTLFKNNFTPLCLPDGSHMRVNVLILIDLNIS